MVGKRRLEILYSALRFVSVDSDVPRKPPQAICVPVMRHTKRYAPDTTSLPSHLPRMVRVRKLRFSA